MTQGATKKPICVSGERSRLSSVNVAQELSVDAPSCILLGVSEAALAIRLAAEVGAFAPTFAIVTVPKLASLRELAANSNPKIIFLDSDLLGGRVLSEAVPQLATFAPVFVLAPVNSHAELSRLIALGNVEFIGKVGDYVPLVLALIERRLNEPRSRCASTTAVCPQLSATIGELFRHEINNPLTGILGNVELVLAHREHLSPVEVQRLQTVVDLAVRLRESVRRVGGALEENLISANSR
jgi:signal transduction histidine kinase